jgi:hypothetical protein
MIKSKMKKKKKVHHRRVAVSYSQRRYITLSDTRGEFNFFSFLTFAGCIIYIIGLFLPCYFDDRFGGIPGIYFFYLGGTSLLIMAGVAVIAFFGFLKRKNYGTLMVVLNLICVIEPMGMLFAIWSDFSNQSMRLGYLIILVGSCLTQVGAVFLVILKKFSSSIPY